VVADMLQKCSNVLTSQRLYIRRDFIEATNMRILESDD
jgi:hypothetical protein